MSARYCYRLCQSGELDEHGVWDSTLQEWVYGSYPTAKMAETIATAMNRADIRARRESALKQGEDQLLQMGTDEAIRRIREIIAGVTM